MDRFVGRVLEALVEEALENDPADPPPTDRQRLYLGRVYCQAPEVDGLVVLRSATPLVPGTFVTGRIIARTGFDLEMAVL
jgi:ribosomal protein S12 methylthiotransferase